MILCRNLLKNAQFRQSKARKNHRFMLDSKSCRHSWKWEGWFCCKRWPFSHCYCTKITSFNKADIWEMAKIVEQLSINPTIGVYQHVRSLSHRDAVIIQRLCIGHTQLTYSYLLSGTDQPECLACHCPLTVKHILIECPALTSSHNKHFTASLMKDHFDNVAARNIVNSIKEPDFYSKNSKLHHQVGRGPLGGGVWRTASLFILLYVSYTSQLFTSSSAITIALSSVCCKCNRGTKWSVTTLPVGGMAPDDDHMTHAALTRAVSMSRPTTSLHIGF